MSPEDKFRFLLAMAAADESITREELRLLGQRALRWGISDDQFEALLDEAIQGDVQLNMPSDRRERTEILADMIRMMGADGRIDDREKRLFANIAARADLDSERIHEVIDAAIIGNDDEATR